MKDNRASGVLGYIMLAVVFIGLLVGMMYVAGKRLEVAEVLPIQPDTDAWTKAWCGVGSPDFYVRGHYGNEPDTKGDHNNEVFERSTVWYSWTAEGESFPVLSSANVDSCGLLGPTFPEYVIYKWYYTEDKKDWVGFGSMKYPEGATKFYRDRVSGELGSQVFTIQGYGFRACTDLRHDVNAHTISCAKSEPREIKDGAVLRVEVWGGYGGVIGGYPDTLLAYDELQLRSAIPYVHWVKARYKVGETAQVSYRVPTVTDEDGGRAYFMQVIDCNTDLPLEGWDKVPIESSSGKFGIVINESMISNDLATCQNRLRAMIWSELIVAAIEDTSLWSDTTIESGMVIPVVTEIQFDKQMYFEGDSIILTWKATGNITKFHVTVDIGALIIYDDDVSGTVNSVTVRAARAGTAQAQVTAYNKCFTGDVKRDYAVVSGAPVNICMAYPDLPQCKQEELTDWIGLIISMLAVIFLIIGFFFLVWLFSHYEIDLMIGMLISVVIILIGAIALIYWGAFDALLEVV